MSRTAMTFSRRIACGLAALALVAASAAAQDAKTKSGNPLQYGGPEVPNDELPIDWAPDFETAMARGREQGKPVVVVFRSHFLAMSKKGSLC